MAITYSIEPDLSAEEFRAVLIASTLGERRPVDDLPRLDRMLRQADVVATARDGRRLVGISRAVTDFSYCCYLSDLAVDAAYQRQGIGKRLIAETHRTAGELTSLVLVAAPGAESYYPGIGMQQRPSCCTFRRKR
jgi:predicted N-acetyltransferase YhbS